MLDLPVVDIASLAEALEDRSTEWWFDPRNGQLEPRIEDLEDMGHPEDRGLRLVEPIDSSEAYGDMEDFVATVPDARARDLLARAITGKGAFRRFKDTLYEFPDLREDWFALKDARMRRRALHWLVDEGLVGAEAVEQAAADATGSRIPRPVDATTVASTTATGLRALYGARLRGVLLSARERAATTTRNPISTSSSSSTTCAHPGKSGRAWTDCSGRSRTSTGRS